MHDASHWKFDDETQLLSERTLQRWQGGKIIREMNLSFFLSLAKKNVGLLISTYGVGITKEVLKETFSRVSVDGSGLPDRQLLGTENM